MEDKSPLALEHLTELRSIDDAIVMLACTLLAVSNDVESPAKAWTKEGLALAASDTLSDLHVRLHTLIERLR
jgi:hypothetical protein